MAFAQGNPQREFPRYIGLGVFNIVGTNPTAAELSEIQNGREIANEPVYVGTAQVKDKNGNVVEKDSVDIVFYIKAKPELNNGIETSALRMSFRIVKSAWYSSKGKLQVIDEYGRSAWMTQEEIDSKSIPTYTNGQPKVSQNFRLAYYGEVALTEFIKNYKNIPEYSYTDSKTGKTIISSNPELCAARFELDDIKNLLKGNFKDFKQLIALSPDNTVKIAIGVKTTDEGKIYQDVYSGRTLKTGSKSTASLLAHIVSSKDSGMYKNSEFYEYAGVNEDGSPKYVLPMLKKYNPAPSVIPESTASAPQVSAEENLDMPESAYDVPFPDSLG